MAMSTGDKRRGKEERAKITISVEKCAHLVKMHVEDPVVHEQWMQESIEAIIIRYSVFLQALIAVTNRCSVNILKNACKRMFEAPGEIADHWANKVHKAFQRCVTTGRTMKDGARLKSEVATTAFAFKRKLSPSPSPQPSSPSLVRVKAEVQVERGSSSAERAASAMWDLEPVKQECPVPPKQELPGPPAIFPASVEAAVSLWADCKEEPRDEKPKEQVVVRAMHACALVNRGSLLACLRAALNNYIDLISHVQYTCRWP